MRQRVLLLLIVLLCLIGCRSQELNSHAEFSAAAERHRVAWSEPYGEFTYHDPKKLLASDRELKQIVSRYDEIREDVLHFLWNGSPSEQYFAATVMTEADRPEDYPAMVRFLEERPEKPNFTLYDHPPVVARFIVALPKKIDLGDPVLQPLLRQTVSWPKYAVLREYPEQNAPEVLRIVRRDLDQLPSLDPAARAEFLSYLRMIPSRIEEYDPDAASEIRALLTEELQGGAKVEE